MTKEEVRSVFRIGRRVVAHTFIKDGKVFWHEGTGYDNKDSVGVEETKNHEATRYALAFAEHIGRDEVKEISSDGTETVWSKINGKWERQK